MYSYHTKVLLLPLLCLSFSCQLCKCQTTTICSNESQIDLVGKKTVGYIISFNYPGDYTSNQNGDCRMLLTSTESKIKVTIINFIRRRSEHTLRFYDGTSDQGSVRKESFSLSTNTTFTSKGRSLYITHWSIGESNNAFRISYQGYTDNAEEGDDQGWIPGVVVGVLVFLYFSSHCFCNKRRPQQRSNPTPRPQQTPAAQTTSVVQVEPQTLLEDETSNRRGEPGPSSTSTNVSNTGAPVPDLISNNDVNYQSPPPPYHIAVLYSEQAEGED